MTRALRLHHTLRDRFQRLAPVHDYDKVHFHQGPQGQASPCFDTDCPNPRLNV